MKQQKPKTINDVTKEEWGTLAEAAVDLLSCSRFMFWLRGGDNGDDTSVRDSLDTMAAALAAIGLPQPTIEQFETNVESMLRSGKHPDVWAAEQREIQ